MKTHGKLGAAISVFCAVFATHALADDTNFQPQKAGTFEVNLRVSDVVPSADDPIYTAAGVNSGLRVQVSDAISPTLGFTYFINNNFALEAILTATQHDIFAVGDGASTKVHSTWVLPPVVSLQYHPLPKARISPYVGAGANLMVYFAGGDYNGFNVALKDRFGYAFQAGVDVALTRRWALNFDAKKVFTHTIATIDSGALTSDVHLDPWVVSVGLERRF